MSKESVIDLTFGGGIDELARAELFDPTSGFVTLENVRQEQRGGVSKRPGLLPLSIARLDGSNRPAGLAMFPYGKQIGVIDGHDLDVWDPVLGVSVTRDHVPECGPVERVILPYPGASPTVIDCAVTTSGMLVVATMAGVNLNVTVTDATTEQLIRTDILTALGGTPWVRMAFIGNIAIVVYAATTSIFAQTLDCTNAASIQAGWSAPVTLDLNLRSGFHFDTHSFSDRFAVAWPNNIGGTNQLTVATFNAALALIHVTTVNTSSIAVGFCSCAGIDGDTLWVSWNQNLVNRVIGLDPTTLAITATATTLVTLSRTTTQHTMVARSAGHGTVVVEESTSAASIAQMLVIDFKVTAGAVAADGATRTWFNLGPVTKPWMLDGRMWCLVAPADVHGGGDLNRAIMVANIGDNSNTLRPVATIAPGVSVPLLGDAPHVALVSGKKYVFVNRVVRNSASLGTGSAGPSLEATYLDFNDVRRFQSLDFNGNLYFTGGLLSFFDGHLVREANFLRRPDAPATTFSGTGVTDTNIRYVAVYEAVDASGNVEWSAVSDPSGLISPSNQGVNVTVSTLAMTSRWDAADQSNPVSIALYRTTNAGTTYFRVGSVVAIPGSSTVGFLDTMVTSTLITQPQLYKAPGIPGTAQDRFCPSGFSSMATYNGMLCGVGDDGYTIWYSGQQVIGEGAWWNPIFTVSITDDGKITALHAQDGALFIWMRRAIWMVAGEAPSDNGASGGLGTPRRLACDVGCIDARSIVATSRGIFFQSERGIELLTRAQSVEWIGEAVRETLAAYPIIASARLDSRRSLVYFECAQSQANGVVTGSGVALVYDLARGIWTSKDIRLGGTPAQSSAVVFDASTSTYRYAILTAAGVVYVEQEASYLENGAWVAQKAETAWIHIAGLQGEQSVDGILALCDKATDHDLTLTVYFDYLSTTAEPPKVFTAAEIAALGRQWLSKELVQSTSTAIKVILQDATPSSGVVGTGKGATWIGLAFPGIPHRGVRRTSAAQRGA